MTPTKLPSPGPIEQVRLMRGLFNDPQPVLDKLRDRYGPVAGLGFGPARMAIVGDPVALRELFATPTPSFRWNHKFNALAFVVGPGSMIVSDGPDHTRRRASVQAAFSRRRLNGWIPIMVEQTDHAVDRLIDEAGSGSATIDVDVAMRRLVMEVVLHAFFGSRLEGRAVEIMALIARMQAYLERPPVRQFPHPVPFTERARVRQARRDLDAITMAEIAAVRRSPSGDPLDLLEALVLDGGLSDSEICDQVMTLIGAGFDTTVASLAWILWRAMLTPGVWNQLRVEADEVYGSLDGEGEVPRDHMILSRLHFADRVMRETLRLHPAGVFAPREAVVDVEVGGYRIEAGTLILWSAYLAGRDAAMWPDPLQFDPERFLDPTPDQKAAASQAWVPFGRGERNCIGFVLAQMELTLIISRFAQRLDVTPISTAVPQPIGMVVNRPMGGVPMRVAARAS